MGTLDIDRLEDRVRLKRIEEKLDSLLNLMKESKPVEQKYSCPTCKDKGVVNKPVIESKEYPDGTLHEYIKVMEISCPTCTRNQNPKQENLNPVQRVEAEDTRKEKDAQRVEAEESLKKDIGTRGLWKGEY